MQTAEERVHERQRLMGLIHNALDGSTLFDEMKHADYRRLVADMKDVLRKWTAKDEQEPA